MQPPPPPGTRLKQKKNPRVRARSFLYLSKGKELCNVTSGEASVSKMVVEGDFVSSLRDKVGWKGKIKKPLGLAGSLKSR